MKLLIIVLSSFAFISLNSISFADNKQPIDFEKLNKVVYLAKDSIHYEVDGLSIKATKANQEIKRILDSLVVNGRQISSTESCLFMRLDASQQYYGSENRYFRFNCYDPPLIDTDQHPIVFRIFSAKEIDNKHNITSSDIVEKFEESGLFTGKIIITKISYFGPDSTYHFNGRKLQIFCKIVSFAPANKQPAQIEKEVLSPDDLIRNLESGDNVPKSEIIKTLKKYYQKHN